MNTEPNCVLSGVSTSRMFEYLSLCKIECSIRKITPVIPSCHVDQLSKVRTAGTIIFFSAEDIPGSKAFIGKPTEKQLTDEALLIKDLLSRKIRNQIDSILDANLAFIPAEGDGHLGFIPIYEMKFRSDNFAQERNVLNFCFVENQQDQWVNRLVSCLQGQRYSPDCIFVFREGQIRQFRVPKVERRN